MNKKLIIICLSFCLFSIGFSWDVTGNEILRKVDALSVGDESPKDTQMNMSMKIVSPSGNQKIRELRTWTKNISDQDDWRLMKFVSPPDVRDVGFLALSDEQMYLYLPEFRRIRRIASHNKSDQFMGSDFSYEDLGVTSFQKCYEAEIINEEDDSWVLKLSKKPEADKPYEKIEMWVSKESNLPTKMKLYDSSGDLWKEELQENKSFDSYWIPVKITMKNIKEGSWTELTMKEIKTDQGLDSDIFTPRYLKRRVR
ncbi:MAG: outer membrane lipoprotein-sorting protein [Acidobacteriota bacterium]